MRKLIIPIFLVLAATSLFAQDYPQWPADKPETGFIKDSQSREVRIQNLILPQEVDMQDKMRTLFTDMMNRAARQLGWQMEEISEYTNDNALQGGDVPYALRSPRGIDITFQFIVNQDSLQAWRNYEMDYGQQLQTNMGNALEAEKKIQESPAYKMYADSVNYYIKLYSTYCDKHKNEGAALFTKDPHPQLYLTKQKSFSDKMVAMTNNVNAQSGGQQLDVEHNVKTHKFRNETVVQVRFNVNDYVCEMSDQSTETTQREYPEQNVTLAKRVKIQNYGNDHFSKWDEMIVLLLGNFNKKPADNNNYNAGFDFGGQGDEHTPKKIKSDKVQNIDVHIMGSAINIDKMVRLIDVARLNSTIIKI